MIALQAVQRVVKGVVKIIRTNLLHIIIIYIFYMRPLPEKGAQHPAWSCTPSTPSLWAVSPQVGDSDQYMVPPGWPMPSTPRLWIYFIFCRGVRVWVTVIFNLEIRNQSLLLNKWKQIKTYQHLHLWKCCTNQKWKCFVVRS